MDPFNSTILDDNLKELQERLGHSPDIVIRRIKSTTTQVEVAAVYIEGLIEKLMVNEFVEHAMSFDKLSEENPVVTSAEDIFLYMKEVARGIGEEQTLEDWDVLFEALFSGDTILWVNGIRAAIRGNTSGGEVRAVSDATTQVAIRGSKEGFTESIGTNISLVRRKIKSPNLWVESMKIGDVTQTNVSIMYIHGIVNDNTLKELRTKLQSIDIDGILESGYIEQFLEDTPFSPFPTLYNTERPDSVAGNLLEGRVAIFVDGTPFVLIAPTTFFMFLHAVEDYYQRYDITTLIRLLRFICLVISLFGPALFIAILTFHQEMIPTALLINFASQREGVPFPAFIEAMLMEFTFEIIREAGIRMPSPIGQTVSIIGGLVLGQAAVQAGIVSPAMVIVVSLTGISSFATPAFNMALSIRILRFIIMFIAAFMGLYGITIFTFILVAHMCSLKSLGFPYMSPFGPFIAENQKDSILRVPLKYMKTRPRLVSQKNNTRLKVNDGKPGSGK
ncbi:MULTISPECIES: spore germination protein [Paenibacillus]|uniref:Spore germination protein n=2 Tax=Paenibacillus TaxID=44249 RepID=A0A1R0WXQ3_9BACL|nr:spore germination protein [Paenibacillus odorifer]AIQ75557.1 spore gernimation protein KB [Paenibacillus odorifer]MEC0132710.1 spore germination protein [Paenibacillus odorifer]OMD23599.1 spore germination protein [Paenibacillus odorifer]OME25685.1 spore germination protein [Paenibacillus odorifer]OME43936.1 spore germination protein [Paenibacillus odorifer]